MTAEAIYCKDADVVDEVAGGAIAAGEVLQLPDGRAAVYTGNRAAASGDTVGKRVEGIYDVAKASATTFSAGDPVYWDASASQAVNPAATLDGSADFYLGLCVKAAANGDTSVRLALNVQPYGPLGVPHFVYEFDCETGVDSDAHVLIPGVMNQRGLLILGVYGVVTEVFGGASQDQGIVTVADEDGNAIATLTPSDGGADASGDVIVGTGKVLGGATGDAVKTVAAGKYVKGTVTQATSGAGAAGKMRVYVLATPLI